MFLLAGHGMFHKGHVSLPSDSRYVDSTPQKKALERALGVPCFLRCPVQQVDPTGESFYNLPSGEQVGVSYRCCYITLKHNGECDVRFFSHTRG